MLIVGTHNTECGITLGHKILKEGRSAIDAVEATMREVETNANDDSVGLGGLPNILGHVELDASIMDGNTLRAGAVGALKGFLHPISVARKVMDLLPHSFLVGEGAATFAKELGMETSELLVESAREKYLERLRDVGIADPAELQQKGMSLREAVWQTVRHRPMGTACVIAIDHDGHFCCGVTTSGWAFKYPGRLGDSPVIGAGNYADDRYGAAACTGMGEIAIRVCAAHLVVLGMASGKTLEEATSQAIQEAQRIPVEVPFVLNVLAVDKEGKHTCYSTSSAHRYYLAMSDTDDVPQRFSVQGLAARNNAPASSA